MKIQALSPYCSNQSFTIGIRLRCPDRRTQHSESEGALQFRAQLRRKDRIAIVNEELIGMIARNGVPQLSLSKGSSPASLWSAGSE
jgi:hypothetical protein